jgi:tetratricopeptide (TPR) repeat protein
MMFTNFASSNYGQRIQLSGRKRLSVGFAGISWLLAGTCLISCGSAVNAQGTPLEGVVPPAKASAAGMEPVSAAAPTPAPAPDQVQAPAPAANSSSTEASQESSPSASAAGSPSESRNSVRKDLITAGDLMLDGKYAEAADIYRAVLNTNSKETNALAGLGMALGRQFKLDAADEQFEKLLTIDPNNPVAHCGKAMVILNRLQSSSTTVINNRSTLLKEAGKECNLALDADPRVVEAHYLLGRVYKEEGRNDRACLAFQGAIKLDPHYSNAYAQLGLIQVLLNKLSEATESFKKAISINSGNSTAHFGMAQVAFKQNRLDAAVAELNISLYQNPNSSPVHQLLGKVYEAQGNTVAAIKEFKEAIRIKPELAAPYLSIASVAESRGDIEMAIAELHSGLEVMPNDPELLIRIANDSLRIDKFDDAVKNFEAAAAAAPSTASPIEGLTRVLYLKAQKETSGAYFVSNDYAQANILVQKAIKLNPNSIELRLVDAKLRALSGQPVSVAKMPLPQSDADRPAYAETLMAEGKYQEAAAQMVKAINATTDTARLFAIGDLALMIKDLPSAELAYKRAASFVGQTDRANRGLDLIFKAREEAKQNLNLANDLARRRQMQSAIDKFKLAAYQDPKVADTHLFLAQTIEKLAEQTSKTMRETIAQYKAYLELAAGVPAATQDKLQKKVARLETKALKIEQSATLPRPSLLQRVSTL